MGAHSRVSFTGPLLAWFDACRRTLPWRTEPRDPYRVWLSEIMLQQTRVEAMLPYFERFLEEFPTVAELARAPEERVLACWSGLGYYSRARNLFRTAARIVRTGFPHTSAGWRELPGVGPYTAAAIASIVFGEICPALDGNVLRVVARITGDPADISAGSTRRRFEDIVRVWLDPVRPGATNEALMELGATVCLPRAPHCSDCPIAPHCRALAEGRAAQLPVKLGKPEPQRIEVTFAWIEHNDSVLLRRRAADESRMAGFWELPFPEDVPGLEDAREVGAFRHTITNHRYLCTVIAGTLKTAPPGMRWFRKSELARIPLSTTCRKALRIVDGL